MPNGHIPAMLQVTAMDDQFGTHNPVGEPQRRCCRISRYDLIFGVVAMRRARHNA
jgi:hypothetical protein